MKKTFLLFLIVSELSVAAQKVDNNAASIKNPLSSPLDSQVHRLVTEFYNQAKPTGLLIGISRNGAQSYYSYGYADSASGRPFTANTLFEAGSVTKTFTANLLLQLEEGGYLKLQESLTSFLPVMAKDSSLHYITLRNLVNHSSGLPRLPANLSAVKGFQQSQPYLYNRTHLYAYLEAVNKIKPGSYNYSNLGFGLLGTIMELRTGYSYESLLNRFILQPLQMDYTFISDLKRKTDTATGYALYKPVPYWTFDCMAGAGALRTTASDLLRYLDAHHRLSQETTWTAAVNRFKEPGMDLNKNIQIGYGWHTLESMKYRVYWHNGGTQGFCTFTAWEPNTRTSVVVVVNQYAINNPVDQLGVGLTGYLINGQNPK